MHNAYQQAPLCIDFTQSLCFISIIAHVGEWQTRVGNKISSKYSWACCSSLYFCSLMYTMYVMSHFQWFLFTAYRTCLLRLFLQNPLKILYVFHSNFVRLRKWTIQLLQILVRNTVQSGKKRNVIGKDIGTIIAILCLSLYTYND